MSPSDRPPSWMEEQLLAELRANRESRAQWQEKVLELLEGHETNANRRHNAMLVAVAMPEARHGEHLLEKVWLTLTTSPMLRQAVGTALGLVVPALAAWLVFQLTGMAPTPNPMEVVAPTALSGQP